MDTRQYVQAAESSLSSGTGTERATVYALLAIASAINEQPKFNIGDATQEQIEQFIDALSERFGAHGNS